MSHENIVAIWVKLSNVSNTFEQQSISKLASSCNKLIKLTITGKHVGVSLICGKVYGQSYKLLANYWLWAMDYKLVY
jgi:hypothetical protein